MEIRSSLLSSETTRRNLRSGMDRYPEIAAALGSIDRIGGLYDAIRGVHEAINPNETPEARAMRYEKQFNKVVREAREIAARAGAGLDRFAESIRMRALHEAGLSHQPASASEIRASLRGMSQSERDKVISEAFDRGDTEVLASIYGQNRVIWGGSSKPLDKNFQLFIEKAAPESVKDREALDKATEGLSLAVDSFVKSAEKWRDPLTAARGFQQEKEFAAADAALKAALGASE